MTDDELARFTPTERKILAVLADGERHNRREFHGPLGMMVVEKGDDNVLNVHMCNLKVKLGPMGKWVIAEKTPGGTFYSLVKLVKPLMPIS